MFFIVELFVPAEKNENQEPIRYLFFWFEAATQLARQVYLERTQVVCSNKADRIPRRMKFRVSD